MRSATTYTCSVLLLFAMLYFPNTVSAQCAGLPAAIPDNDGAGINISCTINGIFLVDNVTLDVDITHTWVGDLIITITSPDGTTATVVDQPIDATSFSCFSDDMNITLTSDGTDGNVNTDCNYTNGGSLAPAYIDGGTYTTGPDDIGSAFDAENAKRAMIGFSHFKGTRALGVWTVNVNDNALGDDGTINGLNLNVSSTPLPVELVSFEATVDGNAALLSWETASERENAGFEIQRATSTEAFETIGYVEGAGTTVEAQSYSFRVSDLEYGTHQFRLKQIDLDGQFAYSETIEATHELAVQYAIQPFYPNPFNPQGNFTLMVAQDQEVQIGVYNVMGQLVDVLHQGFLQGQEWHRFTFQAGNALPGGNYFIRVTSASFVATQKVSLVK